MFFRRRKFASEYEFYNLAVYNGQVAEGLVHHALWVELMRREKQRFDAGEPSCFFDEQSWYQTEKENMFRE